MDIKKRTYKTKEVNLTRLAAFYNEVKKQDKNKEDGKRDIR